MSPRVFIFPPVVTPSRVLFVYRVAILIAVACALVTGLCWW